MKKPKVVHASLWPSVETFCGIKITWEKASTILVTRDKKKVTCKSCKRCME